MLFQIMQAYSMLRRDQRGVTALEYAVVAGVIVTIIAAAFTAFGGAIQTALLAIAGNIKTGA